MDLAEKLERLPDRPGVYLYKDAKGQVVYVGKAASIRARVRSYFQASRTRDAKTDALVDHIADLDYIVTANELEALDPRVEPGQAAPAPLQHHPPGRQALPLPEADHERGVPASPRRSAGSEGWGDLLRPVLPGDRPSRDPPPGAGAVAPPDLQHQDRRAGRAPVPPVLHPPVQRPVHGVGDARGLRPRR